MSSDERTHALKLTIVYDGTMLWGSQRQAKGRTVQQELERSLEQLGFEQVSTVFAGRTDRGVHALGQVVRCDDERPDWDEEKIARAINAGLPSDISVAQVSRVSRSFHPRYDAIWREYRYRIWCGGDQPLGKHHTWCRRTRLDVEAMMSAASSLIGTHDLAAFTGGGEGVPWSDRATSPRGTIRTVFHCSAREVAPWWGIRARSGIGIEIRMIADGFLPRLVRTVVGALTTIGMKKQSQDWITELIGRADRRNGPVTAPPHGLVLWHIGYGDENPEPEPDGRQITVITNALTADG